MHIMKRLINPRQILPMRDKLIDFQGTVLVIGDEFTHLRTAFDAAEGAAFPYAACDQLEGYNTQIS